MLGFRSPLAHRATVTSSSKEARNQTRPVIGVGADTSVVQLQGARVRARANVHAFRITFRICMPAKLGFRVLPGTILDIRFKASSTADNDRAVHRRRMSSYMFHAAGAIVSPCSPQAQGVEVGLPKGPSPTESPSSFALATAVSQSGKAQ